MLPKIKTNNSLLFVYRTPILLISFLIVVPILLLAFEQLYLKQKGVEKINQQLQADLQKTNQQVASLSAEMQSLKAEDLRKTNDSLKKEIALLKENYKSALVSYEDLVSLRAKSGSRLGPIDSLFASLLNYLSKDDLGSTKDTITKLAEAINKEEARLITASVIPANTPELKDAPSSGFRRQQVLVDGTSFLVDIIAADLNSTKVVIDTASDSTCTNNCPVLPLATFVSRSGAYAGVNGTYFCPDTYPACTDKKNTFDVLVMNKNKVYFNSDNNVYSTVPAVIFSGNSARFVNQSLEWGRDTSVDAVIANRPLLVKDGNNMFSSGGEAKEIIRGPRSFVGASGNTAYIGIVHSATVAEAAKVLWSMGVKNAINLDDGGSSALWSGGYKAGPGRNLPNAVLFVRK